MEGGRLTWTKCRGRSRVCTKYIVTALVLAALSLGLLSFYGSTICSRIVRLSRPHYECKKMYYIAPLKDSYKDIDLNRRIYFSLVGRLGNNLFQIAAIYGMAKDSGSAMYFINGSLQGSRILQLFPQLKNLMKFVPCEPPGLREVKEKAPNQYKDLVPEIKNHTSDVKVHGFLGAFNYFWPKYDTEIRPYFKFSPTHSKAAEDYIRNLTSAIRKPSTVSFVGIQVRRGDKAYARDGWVLPNGSYFEKAMRYFRKKFRDVVFVVISEDKTWAQTNIKGSDVVYSTLKDDLLELTILGKCNHTIMSAGTYSWWAAWLSGGEAVYFQNHTVKGSTVAGFFNDKQYFLPHWVPMGD